MDNKIRILAINPGSTSTKIALYDDDAELFSAAISHSLDELKDFNGIQDQLAYRAQLVAGAVADRGYAMEGIDVFSGRGGGLLPVAGGVFAVTDLLVRHASIGMAGQHPAQLAPQIIKLYADTYGKPAVVVNPPSTDEFRDIARITGVKGVYRQSHIHALNQKETALRFCASRGLKYEDINLIVCHLGGGISVTAHERGRMVDSNDIIGGSGPMSPTRAGDLPYIKVIDMAYSGRYTKSALIEKLNVNGGLTDHFGTTDVRDVLGMISNGDNYAGVVLGSMLYQVAKHVGAMAAAMKGIVDAVILTGGIANNKFITDGITEYIGWIAEIAVIPGEFELEALAAGALRVMRGEEEIKIYTGQPVWS